MTQTRARACRLSPMRRPKAKTMATEITSICQTWTKFASAVGFSKG